MAESTGWTRPLSDRLPNINPKGILEFKPQKEFPTARSDFDLSLCAGQWLTRSLVLFCSSHICWPGRTMHRDPALARLLLFLLTLSRGSKCQTHLRDTLRRLICFQSWEQSLFRVVRSRACIVQFTLAEIRAGSIHEALPISPKDHLVLRDSRVPLLVKPLPVLH